jgi:serine/threonine protein kinase
MAYTFKHGDRPLDDYTIQRAVGGGGFGEVYYAISDGGREVALKYLRDNPQVELRGVSHCMNLKSPHLVTIFDVRKSGEGDYFIIMEYISGPSLRDLLIAEPGGLGPQKAAFFAREIAKGLAYLHDRGIVHRDLKPGNIFYDDGYVKIGDYGLSKFISVSRHSAQTASVGTVHYMAPEIGSGNYSRGVDIYALGVILYEMLLGKVPFEGSSMGEVLMKHLTSQPEVDHLPEPFAKVIRKALEKEPKDRYQTVDEMVENLLQVETVRQSLAGFSPQSLDGAVARGGASIAPSPVPSPNPAATPAPGFMPPQVQPAATVPNMMPPPLTDRLARRMDHVTRKMERKMQRLAGKRPKPKRESRQASPHAQVAPPPPPPAAGAPTPQPSGKPSGLAPAISRGEKAKRAFVAFLMSMAIVVGTGLLSAAVSGRRSEEFGIAGGMMAACLFFGVLLSRAVTRWVGRDSQPTWVQRFIQLICCAPLVFMGAIPAIERADEEGIAMAIGVLLVGLGTNWGNAFERGARGNLGIGNAFAGGLVALAVAAAVAGMMGGQPERAMFPAALAAAAASLVVHVNAWWFHAPGSRKWSAFESGERGGSAAADRAAADAARRSRQQQDAATRYGYEAGNAHDAALPPFAQPVGPAGTSECCAPPYALRALGPRERWGITRGFWGLVSFALIAGAISTLLVSILVPFGWRGDHMGVIIACVACFAGFLFAIRKTSPLKKDNFWRESLRPFLLSASLFGIGAIITAISFEWGCCRPDDRGGMITGLVFCSLAFLTVFFVGRKPRPRKPFLLQSDSDTAHPTPDPQQGDAAPEP